MHPTTRTRRPALLLVLALIATMALNSPTATAAVAGGGGYPLEDYPGYQPQTRCNPKPKPGTEMLARWLQKQYAGTGSLGISRSCGTGGASEHKEGRAFDWAVSAGSDRDRRYVSDLLDRLRAPDRAGNPSALARRMGIMYLIWDDHIYSAWDQYRARDYRHAACRRLSRCSASLRHRNHVHLSLTRRAALARTSWYLRRLGVPPPDVPAPPPEPEPEPVPEPTPQRAPRDGTLDLSERPYVRLAVPADGTVKQSRFRLRGGTAYRLTVGGLYAYGSPRQVADASCVWTSADGWVRRPTDRVRRRHGSLELTVNGRRLFDTDCRLGKHVYRTTFTPRTTGPLKLRVDNRRAGAATGRLVVTVSRRGADVAAALPAYPTLRPAPAVPTVARGFRLLGETVTVPGDRGAVRTVAELTRGAAYRLTVSGSVRLGGGYRTDGLCVSPGGDRWYRQVSLDRRFPDRAHGLLHLDGAPLDARADCGDRRHVVEFTAPRHGRATLALWDPLDRRDNSGALTVRLQRLTEVATPSPGPRTRPRTSEPWRQRRDWVEVATDRRAGTLTTMRLRKGETVQLVARGTFRSGRAAADPACVATGDGWLRRDPDVAVPQDPFELWVDGRTVAWRALGKDGFCSAEHGYTARFTATRNGPLRLAVLDVDHRDNRGTLGVTVLR